MLFAGGGYIKYSDQTEIENATYKKRPNLLSKSKTSKRLIFHVRHFKKVKCKQNDEISYQNKGNCVI